MKLKHIVPPKYNGERYTKNEVIGTIIFWSLYAVIAVVFIAKTPTFGIIFALIGALNLLGPIVQLKSGKFRAPGTKYRKSVSDTAQVVLAEAKQQVKKGNGPKSGSIVGPKKAAK